MRSRCMGLPAAAGGTTGGGLVVITVLALGCVWRKRRVKAAEEEMDIDEDFETKYIDPDNFEPPDIS